MNSNGKYKNNKVTVRSVADRVPCGRLKGRKWSSLSDRILLAALFCHNPHFSARHLDAVIAELLKRKR